MGGLRLAVLWNLHYESDRSKNRHLGWAVLVYLSFHLLSRHVYFCGYTKGPVLFIDQDKSYSIVNNRSGQKIYYSKSSI
jgi:hypothetical protein